MSFEGAFEPRYRLPATILAGAAAALGLVGFVQSSVKVSAPSLSLSEETSLFDLGWDWVPLTLAIFLLVFGAFRLARRDSQARGFLIVGGIGVVLFALWEILTIQDRAINAAATLVDSSQADLVRASLHEAVARGLLSIAVSVGIYLVLVAGVLAVGAVALCFISASGKAAATPTVSTPPPPAGSLEPGAVPTVAAAPIHPPGDRCLSCKAILADDTNLCWYCGRLWAPAS